MSDADRRGPDESRRILERVRREEGASGLGMARRVAGRVNDHVTAKDGEATDGIELWGTRIGRVLGLAVMAVLAVLLLTYVFGG
jgi:hypothetical protein